jgi:hypothetical protein
MFSITPFLNRTVSVIPENSGKEREAEAVETEPRNIEGEPAMEVVQGLPPAERVDVSPTAAPKPRGRKRIADNASVTESQVLVLGEAKSGNKNKKAPAKKPRALSTLEKVTEEEGDENELPDAGATSVQKSRPVMVFKAGQVKLKNTETEDNGPTKKKRKLLGGGKTLFDEEDGEATKRPAKVALGPPRLLGKGGLTGAKGGLKRGLGTASGFGGFSPLKKDRRGIGASFLA